jgi:Flp pilus assembly protein TadG
MKSHSSIYRRDWRQRGAAAVEFALVAVIFFTLLIGIMQMGRLLFYWNSATEATRWGARIAVVCNANAQVIRDRMSMMLPLLNSTDISISYAPSGCDIDAATARASCQSVTVSINSTVSVSAFIPLIPLTLTLPPFTTTLTRESMDSASGANPICS